MPVRIIFRGLILFRFPTSGDDAGKLVAELINKRDIPRRPKKDSADKPPHGPHEHNHDAQIQIATDHGKGDERLPVDLVRNDRIDITALGADGKPLVPAARVQADPSFLAHVPDLVELIHNGTDNVKRMEADRGTEDPALRTTVTVDRGRIRVREVITWDEGGFPLDPSKTRRGEFPASPGFVRFVGSDLQGHVASEFIVDILDATTVDVQSEKTPRVNKTRPRKALAKLNHRTPYDTVEILITNYEYQENTALPWGLDFQWLFEAAGYPAVDLTGTNLNEFDTLGSRFNPGVYEHERRLLLDPVDNSGSLASYRMGRPFPYLTSVDTLQPLKKKSLTGNDEDYRPICIGGRH